MQGFKRKLVYACLFEGLAIIFTTVGLSVFDWVRCVGAASTVFWAREANKVVTRFRDRRRAKSS